MLCEPQTAVQKSQEKNLIKETTKPMGIMIADQMRDQKFIKREISIRHDFAHGRQGRNIMDYY